jgi:hypothetical protein
LAPVATAVSVSNVRTKGVISKDNSRYSVEKQDPINNIPFNRTTIFPIEELAGQLPSSKIDADTDHKKAVLYCLEHWEQSNLEVFTKDAIWRDVFALTGTLRTFNGRESIRPAWKELLNTHRQSGFTLMQDTSKILEFGPKAWIQARFTFETFGKPSAHCSGQIDIVPDGSSGWKI